MELKEKIKGLRALIVEDNEVTGSFLHRALSIMGFEKTDLAEDEQTALCLLNQKQYDFVLSDTNYGCSGARDYYGPRIVVAARKLGQDPRVIAMSGLDNNVEVWTGESEADLFLRKPFSLADLKEALEKIY